MLILGHFISNALHVDLTPQTLYLSLHVNHKEGAAIVVKTALDTTGTVDSVVPISLLPSLWVTHSSVGQSQPGTGCAPAGEHAPLRLDEPLREQSTSWQQQENPNCSHPDLLGTEPRQCLRAESELIEKAELY